MKKASSENPDRETVALSTNPEFLEIIERSRARCEQEGRISMAEMRRRLGLDREHGTGRQRREPH